MLIKMHGDFNVGNIVLTEMIIIIIIITFH